MSEAARWQAGTVVVLTIFMSSHWWQRNRGHVLIIPNRHCENLYDMPEELLGQVAILSKGVALAMKRAYGCDGTSVRQHNEPAGGQDVWHYHLHVFPRYVGDDLYHSSARLTYPDERRPYADRLRAALGGHGDTEAAGGSNPTP